MHDDPARHAPMRPIPVAVLGATGSVGQRFVELLDGHPWFRVAAVSASERSTGRAYREAVHWVQETPLPESVATLDVVPWDTPLETPLVFSALGSDVARPIEAELARRGHLVVSNASSHRMDADVPLLVPEVNPEHLALLERQPYDGGIITNPNCSTIGLVLALKPLHDAFGVTSVHVVTLQALSGAGLAGVASMAIADNVIPFIAGEEEKLEREPVKILGTLDGDGVRPASVVVSAQCNRVAVTDGHTEAVAVGLARHAEADEVLEAWSSFRGRPQELALPSAPERPIHVLDGAADPQPRLHRNLEGGMAAAVGRLRPDPLLDHRFVTLSHNTIRGAAGGAILAAELAVAEGYLPHP